MKRWLSLLITVVLVKLCCGCAPEYTDRDPTEQAAAAVSEWDTTVGVLRPGIVLDVVSTRNTDPTDRWQGSTVLTDSGATITLYRGTFVADDFDAQVRHTMLHELVHAHLGMAHSKNKSDLMYPELTDENRLANPSAETIGQVQARWIR